MTDLSIIIVTLKTRDDIPCISKFEESTFDDYEIVVRGDEGISKARNEGVKEASSDKIIFIDDDADPKSGYLYAASQALESHPIVAGKVTHPNDDIMSVFTDHYPSGDTGKYINHVVGCNMAFRREVFDTIGWFDERFNWGHEETEFIDRARTEFPVYYEPKMAVKHPFAESVSDYLEKKIRYGPADVQRARKRGRSDRDLLKASLDSSMYLGPTLKSHPLAAAGGVLQTMSRIRYMGLRNQLLCQVGSHNFVDAKDDSSGRIVKCLHCGKTRKREVVKSSSSAE